MTLVTLTQDEQTLATTMKWRLSETFSPGRKALWNLTKGLHTWNRKGMNRWGVNAMYSADGLSSL